MDCNIRRRRSKGGLNFSKYDFLEQYRVNGDLCPWLRRIFFTTCIFSHLVIWYKLKHTKVFIYLIAKKNVLHIFDSI